uniref:NitT/TauT family transport system permease protein n=1 Tax=Candidatus Kentrum sp. TC TaxID=2126339 RepID=A0A450ZSL3_9GAMM|nr:MAG: NitT/TauT family transport system permease protein [Candidatus Kentron sp. TC]VFK56772.1 MAG: NitT/TauT family transport system permease protein [Candidatus Kentron sp. TC]
MANPTHSRNRAEKKRMIGPARLRSVAGIGGFLLLWEIVAAIAILPENYLPPFYTILGAMADPETSRVLLVQSLVTLARALAGYFIAAAIAVPLGIFLGRSALVSEIMSPLIEFLRPLPSSAIIPVALLFLGLGTRMIIFVVAFGAAWPILVAARQGAGRVDPVMMDVARLLRLGKARLNLEIVLPAAMPFVMGGLRTSLAVSLILAVTAEMLAGNDGIGFFILDMERAFRIREMYAGILSIGVLGFLLNLAFQFVERKVVYW